MKTFWIVFSNYGVMSGIYQIGGLRKEVSLLNHKLNHFATEDEAKAKTDSFWTEVAEVSYVAEIVSSFGDIRYNINDKK